MRNQIFTCPEDSYFVCGGKSYNLIPLGAIVSINFPENPNDAILVNTCPSDLFRVRLYNGDIYKIGVVDGVRIWGDKNPHEGQPSRVFKKVDRNRNKIYTAIFTDLKIQWEAYLKKVSK
jgi:hypothetical protein